MTFMVIVAILVTAAFVAGYVAVQRKRSEALRALGVAPGNQGVRRHLPYAMFLAAVPVLLIGLGRPEAQIRVPHIAGTVILVFDVSKSMSANDVKPNRLAVAQAAANEFVKAQPSTVDIGVVMFGQEGLATQAPTADRSAVLNAIARLKPGGGTSLTRAILASLSTIVGKPVQLPSSDGADQPDDLGYWGSATIVLFSDGQDISGSTDGVDAAAALASNAGVRIETVGIGTPEGTTVEVDGYQVATALNEDLLTSIAQTTGGSYHPAQDASEINDIHRSIDLRLTAKPQPVELTALFAGAGLLLLTIGGVLMIRWHGRIV
jgi:Ca-activated chloride channel family protein